MWTGLALAEAAIASEHRGSGAEKAIKVSMWTPRANCVLVDKPLKSLPQFVSVSDTV